MGDTAIEWTDKTWNPVSGCTKVSAGCKYCYAERVFPRAYSGATVVAKTKVQPPDTYLKKREFTDVLTHPDRLDQPLRWRKPQRVFVNSMSDLFHEDVPFEFIDRVFAVMALSPRHTFQILTKRPERMREYLSNSGVAARVARAADTITVEMETARLPEEIRPVVDYPGYFVSNHGKILSSSGSSACLHCGSPVDGAANKAYCSKKCKQNANYYRRTGRPSQISKQLTVMSPDVGEQGHMRVMLYRNGQTFRELVHRIVLSAFARPPKEGEQACHRNGDPTNNALPNLRWGSQSDNWSDRIRHGNARSYSKLTTQQVEEIKLAGRAMMSKEAVAERFNISTKQVSNIQSGEQWADQSEWPLRNCWAGVSVEDQKTADERIPLLLDTPGAIRFISYEPALAAVDFRQFLSTPLPRMLDWLIVGGESGPNARPFNLQWARDTVAQCKAAGVSCFVKQLGSVPIVAESEWRHGNGRNGITGHLLSATNRKHTPDGFVPLRYEDRKGGDMAEWPEDLRVREFPFTVERKKREGQAR